MNPITFLGLIAVVSVAGFVPSVFAVQPYLGVGPDISVETISQAWYFSDYDGINDSTDWIGSVLSTEGANSGGNAANIMYQGGSLVRNNEVLDARAEVWNTGGTLFTCGSWGGGCPQLDNDVDDNNYVYNTFYWDAGRTKVTFYWDSVPNVGSTYSVWGDYTPGGSDPSENFLVGRNTAPAFDVWYLQVGIESDNTASNVGLDQYDIGWVENVGGSTNGINKPFRSLEFPAHASYTPYISFINPAYMGVGGAAYTNLAADYIKKAGSSVPDGRIEYSVNALDDMARGILVWD